jgi:ABC-type lipoprotein release transport system permease subunit
LPPRLLDEPVVARSAALDAHDAHDAAARAGDARSCDAAAVAAPPTPTPTRARTRASAPARLLLFVALRGLLASRLTFALLVLPIALGVGFQIPNTANLAGSSATLIEEALARGAGDVRVEPRRKGRFADGDALAARIRALVGARAAVPVLAFAGAIGRDGRFHGAPVYGIDPAPAADQGSPVRVIAGAPLAPGDRDGVLVGSTLARRLGVRPGDRVELRLIFSPPEAALVEDDLGRYTMTVRGIAAGSSGAYRFIYADRAFLAAEAGEPGAASAIYVHLADHAATTAAAAAAQINAAIPEARALDWATDDPFVPNVLRANRVVNGVSYAMVIGAIGVPLCALLYIHVLRRRREIGILAALGFRRREIFAIYLLQALLAACVGIALGMLLGAAASAYFAEHPVFDWEGMVVRPLLEPSTFAVPALVVLATTAAAGGYAAWRAARVDPARALQSLE